MKSFWMTALLLAAHMPATLSQDQDWLREKLMPTRYWARRWEVRCRRRNKRKKK